MAKLHWSRPLTCVKRYCFGRSVPEPKEIVDGIGLPENVVRNGVRRTEDGGRRYRWQYRAASNNWICVICIEGPCESCES